MFDAAVFAGGMKVVVVENPPPEGVEVRGLEEGALPRT